MSENWNWGIDSQGMVDMLVGWSDENEKRNFCLISAQKE